MSAKKDEQGQSLVEVALALPVLLIILVGILDLGRAYYTFVALSDAAAEGAAFAAIHPSNTTEAIDRAVDSSRDLVDLDPSMINVDQCGLLLGSPLTVTVEFEYQLLTPFIQTFVPDGTIDMKATVVQSIISGGF